MAIGTSFLPQAASGTKVTANATPTSVNASLTVPASATKLRIYNNGTVMVFARLCYTTSSPPAAANTDMPIGAGQSIIVDGNGVVGLSVLSSTTTACDVYAQWGEGGA